MNREIKFRGKRTYNEEWIYGDLLQLGGPCILLWNEGLGDYDYVSVLPDTVGQYTGLRDTNNVEIYSDDKLRAFQKEQGKAEGFEITDYVYHQNGGFKVFGKCMQDGYTKDNGMLYQFMWCQPGSLVGRDTYWQLDNIEIIGNRFDDHPHLLNPAAGISGTHHMLDPREQGQTEGQEPATETQPEVLPDAEEGNTEG